MKKIYAIYGGVSLFIFGLMASAVNAQVPSASSTLDTIMATIVDTTIAMVTKVFTTYWPYVLVIAIVTGLVALFTRFAKLGTGKGK